MEDADFRCLFQFHFAIEIFTLLSAYGAHRARYMGPKVQYARLLRSSILSLFRLLRVSTSLRTAEKFFIPRQFSLRQQRVHAPMAHEASARLHARRAETRA